MSTEFINPGHKILTVVNEDCQVIEVTRGTVYLYLLEMEENQPASEAILVGEFIRDDIILLSQTPKDVPESLVIMTYDGAGYNQFTIENWIKDKTDTYPIERISQYFLKIFQVLYQPRLSFFQQKANYLSSNRLNWVDQQLVNVDENLQEIALPQYLPIHKDFPLATAKTEESPDIISLEQLSNIIDDFSGFINNVNILIMHRFIRAIPAIKTWEANNALKVAKYDNDLYHQMHQKLRYFFNSGAHEKAAGLYQNDFLSAMSHVCNFLGINDYKKTLQSAAVVEQMQQINPTEYMHYICNKLKLSFRAVTLDNDWYHYSGLTLIGIEEKPSGQFVALIPDQSSGYTKMAADSKMTVSRENVETISSKAFAVYPKLPEEINIKNILKLFLLNNKRKLFTLLFASLIISLLALATPMVTNELISNAIPNAEISAFWVLPLLLAAVSLSSLMFSIVRQFASTRYTTTASINFDSAVMSRYLSLPLSYSKKQSSGEISQKILGMSSLVSLLSGSNFTSLLSGLFAFFSFVLMAYYSVYLALIILLITIIYTTIIVILGAKSISIYQSVFMPQGRLRNLCATLIQGMTKIQLAGKEQNAFAKWIDQYVKINKRTYVASWLSGIASIVDRSINLLTMIAIFLAIALLFKDTMTVGVYIAFNVAFGQFWGGVSTLSSLFLSVLNSMTTIKKSWDVIKTESENTDGAMLDNLDGHLRLNNVSFYYQEDTTILEDIVIDVPSKTSLAIVGPSGSGKSTLLKLMLGFLTPKTGSITYDGQDLSTLDTHSLRSHFGVVLQDVAMQPGSIRDIISSGAAIDDEEIYASIEKVGLLAEVSALPMGLNTVVTENGAAFSGGQRQRMLLARTLVRNPKIIFLDEATSALDNITQQKIKESIDALDCTRIIIAHRLSTIQDCDHIIYLDKHIIEQGSFKELMRNKGQFYKMANRQIA